MEKRIFVGNLPFKCKEQEIKDLFERYGTVHAVEMVFDRVSGKPKGFAFIQMDEAGADAAIGALNGSEFEGRTLRVDEARSQRKPQKPRPEGKSGERQPD